MLIVDDLVDTGRTAAIVRGMLPRAHFATVYAKPQGRPLVDTFVTEVSQDTWIYFPWDMGYSFQPPIKGNAGLAPSLRPVSPFEIETAALVLHAILGSVSIKLSTIGFRGRDGQKCEARERRAAEGPFAVFLALSADYRETLAIGETVDKSSGRALQKVGLGLLVGEILFRFVASLSVVEVRLDFGGWDYLLSLAVALALVAGGASIRLYEFHSAIAWDRRALELTAGSEERTETVAEKARQDTLAAAEKGKRPLV